MEVVPGVLRRLIKEGMFPLKDVSDKSGLNKEVNEAAVPFEVGPTLPDTVHVTVDGGKGDVILGLILRHTLLPPVHGTREGGSTVRRMERVSG